MKSWRVGDNKKDPEGQAEGFISDPAKLEVSAATFTLVKDVAAKLTQHMPGFHWAIQPSEIGGVLNVFCLDFSNRWGYRIKYEDIQDDPKRKQAIRAGREILKRFHYPGIRYDAQMMARVPRNITGEAIPDLSDQKDSRFKKRALVELALSQGKARIIGTGSKGDSKGIVIGVKS